MKQAKQQTKKNKKKLVNVTNKRHVLDEIHREGKLEYINKWEQFK